MDASLRHIKCCACKKIVSVRNCRDWNENYLFFLDRTTLLTSMFVAMFTEKLAAIIDLYYYFLLIAYSKWYFIQCVLFPKNFMSIIRRLIFNNYFKINILSIVRLAFVFLKDMILKFKGTKSPWRTYLNIICHWKGTFLQIWSITITRKIHDAITLIIFIPDLSCNYQLNENFWCGSSLIDQLLLFNGLLLECVVGFEWMITFNLAMINSC